MIKLTPFEKTLYRIADTIMMMQRAKTYLIQDWGKEVYTSRLTNLQTHLKIRLAEQKDNQNVD